MDQAELDHLNVLLDRDIETREVTSRREVIFKVLT